MFFFAYFVRIKKKHDRFLLVLQGMIVVVRFFRWYDQIGQAYFAIANVTTNVIHPEKPSENIGEKESAMGRHNLHNPYFEG